MAILSYCELCGHVVASDAVSCPNCGHPVKGTSSCELCGHLLGEKEVTCSNCGHPSKAPAVYDRKENVTSSKNSDCSDCRRPTCQSIIARPSQDPNQNPFKTAENNDKTTDEDNSFRSGIQKNEMGALSMPSEITPPKRTNSPNFYEILKKKNILVYLIKLLGVTAISAYLYSLLTPIQELHGNNSSPEGYLILSILVTLIFPFLFCSWTASLTKRYVDQTIGTRVAKVWLILMVLGSFLAFPAIIAAPGIGAAYVMIRIVVLCIYGTFSCQIKNSQ